jgi:hypothetical protein
MNVEALLDAFGNAPSVLINAAFQLRNPIEIIHKYPHMINIPSKTALLCLAFLDAGINDWGGISPLTIDHVNAEFSWPSISSVRYPTEAKGYSLRARLPVYPEFLSDTMFISDKPRPHVEKLSDNHGHVPEEYVL